MIQINLTNEEKLLIKEALVNLLGSIEDYTRAVKLSNWDDPDNYYENKLNNTRELLKRFN